MPTTAAFTQVLKEKGLKVTPKRILVYQLLVEVAQPYLLSDIQERLLSKKLNRITLYRILNDLESAGLLRIFFGLDGNKYIEAKFNPIQKSNPENALKHLHFQCDQCELLYCFEKVTISGLPDGFAIKSDKTVLAGTCQNCLT